MPLSILLRFFRPATPRTHFNDRPSKPCPRFSPEMLVLEDRCLMTVFNPLLPNAGTNQAKGLNSVVYIPEMDPAFSKENLPSPKLVTIQNNSSNVVFPILYGANSTDDETAGKVVRVTLTNPGSGYNINNNESLWPKVKITNLTRNPNNAATATVKVGGDGKLYGLELKDGGAGYQSGDQLKVEFDDSANNNKGSGGAATAFVSQYDSTVALYNPKDPKNKTYRGYIGEKNENGKYQLGLLPGHQATVQLPIAFWDGGRLYFATNGPKPMMNSTDPGNPLQNNTEWFYDSTKPSYMVAPSESTPEPIYGANFEDPVTKFANDDAVVLWYNDPVEAHDFGFGTPAQLTEWSFRDPKQFYIAPNMPSRELDTIANYDVSYVDSLAMPASMVGTQVPLRGGPDDAQNLDPGQFAWLGSDMSFTQMQQLVSAFTTTNLTPSAGVPGPNGLGTYFGGLGYDQYYMPSDNSASGGILSVSNPSEGTVQITVGVTGGLHNGGTVILAGLTGQTELNGTWGITDVSGTAEVVNFKLTGVKGNGVPSNGGTYLVPNVGVDLKKVPAGYQVITESANQDVQSGFDGTRYSLVSGGIKTRIETNSTGVSTAGSNMITGVSATKAALLIPGMLWSAVNTDGPDPKPFFPNGTTIQSIVQGTPGNNDATIVMSHPANAARSGQSWTFLGSQFQSKLGKIDENTNTIKGVDPEVGIYLRPGMLVTGPQIPVGTSISSEPNSISPDFQTIKLTKSIGASPANGPFTFTGAPSSYVVRKLIDVWYSWADYYVRQLSDGPNKAPSGSFQGTTTPNKGREDYDSLVLKVNDDNFNMDQLRVGSVVTGTGNTLTPNTSDDPSLNYTIAKIDKKARTVVLSLPVAVKDAKADTFSFVPPKFIIRSEDAPKAPGTIGTIPYTIDFSSGTAAQQKSALDFARTVYNVMQSFSLLLDPKTLLSRSALLLRYSIGGNVGSFKTNEDLFFKLTNRHTLLPEARTHVELRDDIKSILRGVFDFLDPSKADPINWYPDPAKPTPGATLDTGSGPKPIDFGVYNLNPYVWFVHTQLKMSGYGFSLDDDVANTTANTNSLQVAFGGTVYTAPVDTKDPPAPGLANFEAYTGGAKFGTQQSKGFILGSSNTPKDFPGETLISGLNLATVLKLVASTNPSDPIGANITGLGLPPGVTVRLRTGINPVNGEDQSYVTFKTPEGWTPPAENQGITEFTFSGFTTKVPDRVTPAVASAAPGTMVTITGINFAGVLGVTFNGIPGDLVEGPITAIANPDGAMITINTSKTRGLAEGDTITISGVTGQTEINRQWIVTNVVADTSFQLKGIKGNGVASSSGNWLAGTDSAVKVFVPNFTPNSNGTTFPGPTGKVGVRTPSGTNYSTIYFTIGSTGKPTFTGIGQAGKATASGSLKSTVTLFGTGFNGTSAVTFNGSSTPINTFSTNSSGTELTITIPVGTSGTGTFAITVGGTPYTSTGYSFTVNPPAISTSDPFTPSSGPVGALVRIKGTGFFGADDSSTGGVTINGTAATHVTVIDDSTLTLRVGPGTTSGPVVVKTSAGLGNSGASNFTVSAYQTPTITSATPGQGAVGARIELKGSNFTGVNQPGGGITFGGVAATTFQVVDDQTIRVEVPVGTKAGSSPIVVTNPGGLNSAPFDFIVVVATRPVITGFTPETGLAGTRVTIKGSGFTNTTLVQFNLTQAGFVVQDDTTILTTVPPGATTGPITVQTGLGNGVSPNNFVIGVQPDISSFSPDNGNAGTVVTLQGIGFTSVTNVKFNGVEATKFTVIDDDTMTAVVPSGAKTGRITISSSGGNAAASETDFKVNTVVKPTITTFTPGKGSTGTSVTITGEGFTGVTAVTFNGVSASSFTILNDTTIKVTVPSLATTGLISVTNSTGSGSSQTSFIVDSPNAPAFIKVLSGSPQGNSINGAFDAPLKAKVTDSSGNPLGGINVTFTAPTSAASGKFAGGKTIVTVTTDASGVATSPIFTANGTTGVYTVSANVTPALAMSASFALTNLTGNQAYINALFVSFLGRTGTLPELNRWVSRLSMNGGRATVVSAIMRSNEASKLVVQSLYNQLLGRPAESQSVWISQLEKGATIEKVIEAIVASKEFATRAEKLFPQANSNTAFVNSLVRLLLNDKADPASVAKWIRDLPMRMRNGVASDVLKSNDFRTGAVRTFYGDPTLNPLPYQPYFRNLLRRTAAPDMIKVLEYVKSNQDLLNIQADFAETDEFFKRASR